VCEDIKEELRATFKSMMERPAMHVPDAYLYLISIWHKAHGTKPPHSSDHPYCDYLCTNKLGNSGIRHGVRAFEMPDATWHEQDLRIGEHIQKYLAFEGIEIDYEPCESVPQAWEIDPKVKEVSMPLPAPSPRAEGGVYHVEGRLHNAKYPGAHWWEYEVKPGLKAESLESDSLEPDTHVRGARRLATVLRKFADAIEKEYGMED